MGRPAQRTRPAYGHHLTQLREAAGLTQQQLADRLGVHQSNIAFWERWDRPPRGDIVPKLAEVLGVTCDEVLAVKVAKVKRTAGPGGRIRRVFEEVCRLPRRQQEKVAEFVEAFVKQQSASS